jgi:hypothetical protein
LLNCVLISEQWPTDKRIEAFQDAAGILHHSYNAMRLVRRAFDRRHEWPDLSGDLSKIPLGKSARADALNACHERSAMRGVSFQRDQPSVMYDVAASS